jgi:hypothetical protein
MGRKGCADLSRLNLAHDGAAGEPLAIIRDPINELIAQTAKLVGVHGVLQTAA